MYERFFGFTERPFELTANPRYLFLTERYREALGTLTYGLSARKGMLVMTGEAGTGKTTMLTVAMAGVQPNQLVAYLSNPTLTRDEFLEFMTGQLGLPDELATSKTKFLRGVTQLLEDRAAAGNLTALVIDEAHSLPNELLEEVRLLANIERPDQKLLTVILVGQPELAARLNDPSLRQLKQRVALRCELVPLTLRESAAYVAKRISLAGGDSAQVFSREAVLAVYEYSGGIPRTINVLCDNALVTAFARDEHLVSQQVVIDVAKDFDLRGHVELAEQFGEFGGGSHPAPSHAAGQPRAATTHSGAAVVRRPPAATGGAGGPGRTSMPAARPPVRPEARHGEAGTALQGSILDLRPVAAVTGPRYATEPERRSFWETLQFWKR
jgi:general secretion pathway protein A